jgi:hypothetical protein
MTEQKHTEEKKWSEIRDEILKKVEDFTDQQIEKVKASIHKKTAPKVDEVHSDTTHSEQEKRMENEGGRSVNEKTQSDNRQSKSA